MKERERELSTSVERCARLEEENHKMGEELWLAKERVARQDGELGDLHGQLNWERGECQRLRDQMEEEKRRVSCVLLARAVP